MGISSSIHDIKMLALSHQPLIAIETEDEDRVVSIGKSVAIQIKAPFFEWSVTSGLKRQGDAVAIDGTEAPEKMMDQLERATAGIFVLKDLSPHLDTAVRIRKLAEICDRFSKNRATVMMVGAKIEVPDLLKHRVINYKLKLPEESELLAVLKTVVESLKKTEGIKIELGKEDVQQMLRLLKGMSANQVRQVVTHSILIDGALTKETLGRLMDQKVRMISDGGLLEYYPASDNPYEIGGFEKLKEWLARARVGFTEKARTMNLTPPKGIMLVGVPGSGKSLAAKSIARIWGLPLLKLEMGRLYDKYIGETEKNFRKATEMAETMAPLVLWLDELEKALSGSSGGGGDQDGGLSRRLFGSFLTWLQEKRADVFVVATANDISSLPPELLRKGRFDEIFFVDLPNPEERRKIIEIHLRIRHQDAKGLDLEKIIAASEGFTGAEIEQAIISGLYRALHEQSPLSTEVLLKELKGTVPLSRSRAEDIESLRAFARERFVPVS